MGMHDLYTPALIEHGSDPLNKYQMDEPTCMHEGVNPSCGDDIVLSLRIGVDGRIEEAAFTGTGCAVSQASADMMADLIVGKSVKEARAVADLFMRMARGEEDNPIILDEELGEAACLRTIARMPARVKCAELAWRTLDQMLANA